MALGLIVARAYQGRHWTCWASCPADRLPNVSKRLIRFRKAHLNCHSFTRLLIYLIFFIILHITVAMFYVISVPLHVDYTPLKYTYKSPMKTKEKKPPIRGILEIQP